MSKMSWRRILKSAGALSVAGIMMLSNPVTAKAEWTLEGASTVDNDIETRNPSSLITTIQTDFHAGGATGFVVLTPSWTVDSILGITKEMQNAEGRGIIYLANSQCGEAAKDVFRTQASNLGGEVLWYYDMLLFKNDGTANEQQLTLNTPLKMAIGIDKENRGDYNYAMVTYYDGVTKVCPDLDEDDYTITFEADTFYLAAMIRYPRGTDINSAVSAPQPTDQQAAESKNETPAPQEEANTAAPAQEELDDVPKTGDTTAHVGNWLVLSGLMLLAAGGYKIRLKESKSTD